MPMRIYPFDKHFIEGAPSLRFLQEPALSGAEGVGGDVACAI